MHIKAQMITISPSDSTRCVRKPPNWQFCNNPQICIQYSVSFYIHTFLSFLFNFKGQEKINGLFLLLYSILLGAWLEDNFFCVSQKILVWPFNQNCSVLSVPSLCSSVQTLGQLPGLPDTSVSSCTYELRLMPGFASAKALFPRL